jgi:2-hydroxy-6-oxonona-2,4-dienedioate hydrolase
VLNTPGGTIMRAEVIERIRSLSQAAADDPSPERIRARLEWLMADPASVSDELVDVRRAICVTDEELAVIQAPTLAI